MSKVNKKRETTKTSNTIEVNNARKISNIDNDFQDQKNSGENYLSGNFKNEKKFSEKDKWTWRPGN